MPLACFATRGSGCGATDHDRPSDRELTVRETTTRYRVRSAALFIGAALSFAATDAQAAGTLTIAMTAGDLPATTGNPDQGFEGYRFVGYNLYDSLVLWDLSGKNADKAADIKPGLATEWQVDEANPKRWIFKLRQGVKWHDGCDFTADDVVWNMAYSTDDKAPQFNPAQFAQARAYLGTYAGVEKVDDHTIAFITKVPDSLFPHMISYILMVSPCRAKEVKYDWKVYAEKPSGTGPYKFDKAVPHQRMELLPNKEYWDKDRVPKQDRLVLIPMPEASTRTAALLSGQVNWIEAPSPDAIDRLKSSGRSRPATAPRSSLPDPRAAPRCGSRLPASGSAPADPASAPAPCPSIPCSAAAPCADAAPPCRIYTDRCRAAFRHKF